MIEAIIHGLVSGLIWSAILGSCLIAIAAVITVTVPARPRARSETAGTTHALGEPRIPETVRLGRDRAVANGAGVSRVRAGSRRVYRTGEAPRARTSLPGGDLLLADSRA